MLLVFHTVSVAYTSHGCLLVVMVVGGVMCDRSSFWRAVSTYISPVIANRWILSLWDRILRLELVSMGYIPVGWSARTTSIGIDEGI